MKTKPNIIKSVLYSLLFFLIFVIVYAITFFLLGFIIVKIAGIPKIGGIFSFLFESSIGLFGFQLLTCFLGSYAFLYIADKLNEAPSTLSLSVLLCGIYIIAISSYFLICNVIAHDQFATNIAQIIMGINVLRVSKDF